eukprot:TRINITY_DN2487_c1_g1_i3.p1 TRINITY_DN2487_c1_g1~~TRINITY_DN2487_c1_g1_i3.p1  ORF type:complete len:442 (-),score=49.38 TRINITY_DN2487_c1_g1_i3:168-1493(-)
MFLNCVSQNTNSPQVLKTYPRRQTKLSKILPNSDQKKMTWQPSGQNKVGICDFEYDEGFTDISPDTHLVGKLFYPADPRKFERYPQVQWFTNFAYISALTQFLFYSAGYVQKQIIGPILATTIYLVRFSYKMRGRRAPMLKHVEDQKEFPVIVFSHGLGANRNTYSFFCSEMVSHGYVVLTIEHADTSASMVQLAGNRGKLLYDGFGDAQKANKRLNYRVAEMKTAIKVLNLMNEGTENRFLKLKCVKNKQFFQGRLDLAKVAAVGHSVGGATAAESMASLNEFKVGVSLDPYWHVLPSDCNLLNDWKHSAPLMILSSQAYNTPRKNGRIIAGTEQQPQIIQNAKNNRGVISCVPQGSIHNNFDDTAVLLSDSQITDSIMKKLGFRSELDPKIALGYMFDCTKTFLQRHLINDNCYVMQNELDDYKEILGEDIFKLEAHNP